MKFRIQLKAILIFIVFNLIRNVGRSLIAKAKHFKRREFETFRFLFIHADMGTDNFWVKKVEHQLENDNLQITI